MKRLTGLLLVSATLATGRAMAAEDGTSIQFAPPPFTMTNLIATDAVQGKGIDFMSISGNGFNLKSLNVGMAGSDRYWEKSGFSQGMGYNLIYGTFETGPGSDPFTLFGMGFNAPFNFYMDPLSKESDDNSLPIYFGLHVGMNEMFGSMSYETQVIDYYYDALPGPGTVWVPVYKTVTDTMSLMMLGVTVGWQAGIQYGLNLGEAVKFVPYINITHDIYALNMTSFSSSYGGSSSSSENLGPLPLSMAPGFDIILRKIGLSLGAAFQTTKQAGGDLKQLNLHFRWSEHFTSLCGL